MKMKQLLVPFLAYVFVLGIFLVSANSFISNNQLEIEYFGISSQIILLFLVSLGASIIGFFFSLSFHKHYLSTASELRELVEGLDSKSKQFQDEVALLEQKNNGNFEELSQEQDAHKASLAEQKNEIIDLKNFEEKTENWLSYISSQNAFTKPPRAILEEKDIRGFYENLDQTALVALYAIYRGSIEKINLHHAMFRFYLAPIGNLRREMIHPELVNWFNQFATTLISMGLMTNIKSIEFDERLTKIVEAGLSKLSFGSFEMRDVFEAIRKAK